MWLGEFLFSFGGGYPFVFSIGVRMPMCRPCGLCFNLLVDYVLAQARGGPPGVTNTQLCVPPQKQIGAETSGNSITFNCIAFMIAMPGTGSLFKYMYSLLAQAYANSILMLDSGAYLAHEAESLRVRTHWS